VISARKALALLDHALDRKRAVDRSAEAHYYRALLRLEPLPGYDPPAARVDLTEVSFSDAPADWAERARYATAWIHETGGDDERALAAYQRLVVDDPLGTIGSRGRVGLARVLIRSGEFGAAARWLQEAVEAGVSETTGASRLRELAVRRLLGAVRAVDASEPSTFVTGIRSATAMAAVPGAGVMMADVKQNRVVELDAAGVLVGQWTLENLQAVSVGPFARRYAAAGDSVFRLEPGGRAVALTSLGDFAPVSAFAVDARGGIWLLDRRGRKLGRIEPGNPGPTLFWEGEGSRLGAVAWDGTRLVAVDTRRKSVLAFDVRGRSTVLLAEVGAKPVAIAADPSGMLAVLDGKTGFVTFLAANGTAPDPVTLTGVDRPVAVDLDAEGRLHVLDGSNGNWKVWR